MPTTYAIPNGRTVMDATLYTGTGAAQTINNKDNGTVGFYPDMVWIKSRSNVANHGLVDSVRTSGFAIYPNLTSAEANNSTLVTGITSTGFSVADTNITYNQNGATYVGWQWNAGSGSNTTNTSGTITSTVSANTTAGFSIVKWTGSSANATIGHGLGVTPTFIITKYLASTTDWPVYHASISNAISNPLVLNSNGGVVNIANYWYQAPTSTTFGVGPNANGSPGQNIAYCWAPIAGFSAFGGYTGNGSTNGPFIYTGFRPKFLMIKDASGLGSWQMSDTSRSPYNAVQNQLHAQEAIAETTNFAIGDILSNGFKIRQTDIDVNQNGNSYVYAAFAENPFKYANAR